MVTNRFSGQTPPLRVAILDGQQGILDGYHYRLDRLPNWKITVEALNGAEFEAQLAQTPAEVALMDVRAPAAADNPAPYPLVHALPRLLSRYPALAAVVFAVRAEPLLIRAVVNAGASGYIVKSDAPIYAGLPQVLATVHHGGVYYSPSAQDALRQTASGDDSRPLLTRRQLEALALSAAHPRHPISRIAQAMDVSPSTARNLLSQAYERLRVSSRFEAVQRAEQLGLLPRSDPDS